MFTLAVVSIIVVVYLLSAAIAFKILDDNSHLRNKWALTWAAFGPFTLIVLAGIGIYALFDSESRNARAIRKIRHQQNLERARNNP